MSDLRHAFRRLAKAPGFTVVALLMLALGIGLSASSFSMANTFLLRNVPYPNPDQLYSLFTTSPQSNKGRFSPGNVIALRDTLTSFSSFAFYNGDSPSLSEPGQPAERVQAMWVTANFFDTLGVQPSLGRGFTVGEDLPGKPRVAVLTQRAWIRRYASDPNVIGRTVRLNMEPFTIVGVLPAVFDAPLVWGPVEYIVPQTIDPSFQANFKDSWLSAVARLKPGVSLEQASAELATNVGERIHSQFISQMKTIVPAELTLTMSMGIASVQHNKPTHSDLLVALADEALYEAKHRGKNRTIVSEKVRVAPAKSS